MERPLAQWIQLKHMLPCSQYMFTHSGLIVAILHALVSIMTTNMPASLSQQAATHNSKDKLAAGVHSDWLSDRGVVFI